MSALGRFHCNFLVVDSDDNNLCFKFWSFTMKLLHLLGFTKELVFGFSTSVTRFNLFFVCFSMVLAFFKEPAGIVCHTFVAFSI